MFFVWLAVAGAVGCGYVGYPAPPAAAALPEVPGQSNEVFTTAHASFGEAASHYFGRHDDPVQPFDFPHVIHVKQGIGCTEYCHTGVTTGPVAVIPGLNTCMTCHSAIATDKPRIQEITAQSEKGIDMAWKRVFDFHPESHVSFNHAPHIRRNVECATCHGNVAEQTVAKRNVEMTMGFCVNCHNENKAPVDCLTCHN
jgi:hypothetical protein